MGKSTKPVFLVVHPTLVDSPEFVAMREQGHTIVSMAEISVVSKVPNGFEARALHEVDMILGVNAWSFESRQMYLLNTVIQTGRQRQTKRATQVAAKTKKAKASKERED